MEIERAKDIDGYIAGFQGKKKAMLEQIRTLIHNILPDAKETISYSMPSFTMEGGYLLHFAAYKNHIGIYPVPTGNKAFENDLSSYKTSGKGTLQIPLVKPVPLELIKKIVLFRMEENRIK